MSNQAVLAPGSSASDAVPCDDHKPVVTLAEADAVRTATALKALAEPLRLRLLAGIHNSPRQEVCVCDLQALTDVTAPTLSHHLKVMRDAGVLASSRRGTWVYYRIDQAFLPAAHALLEAFVPVASLAVPPAPQPALADVDRQLDALVAELAQRHPALQPELIASVVRESYAALARRAQVPTHLVALTSQFARQRVDDLAHVAADADATGSKPRVLFVCVANAGRSQLAAALMARHAGDAIVVRSAGSAPAGSVHRTVEPLLAELGVEDGAFPKPLTDDAVRAADVVVTMGCGDVCPVIPGVTYEDWPVADPALASSEGLQEILADLDGRVRELVDRLLHQPNPHKEATP